MKNQHMTYYDDPVEALLDMLEQLTDSEVQAAVRLIGAYQKVLRDLPDPSGWTCDDFKQWLSTSGMSLSNAAEALGMSRRQIAYMVSGEKPVLQRTALACIGVLVCQAISRKT
ncbi:MAG TPA: hypothetical protein ENN01_00390 [Halothiobacillus sp.]|nr:hypothetical protein [Halothiobacillus sp.]